MSTKVYTGFKFTEKTIAGISKEMPHIAGAVQSWQRQRFCKALANLVVPMIDMSIVAQRSANPPGPDLFVEESPFELAIEQIWDRRRKIAATMRRDPAVDWEAGLKCWYSPIARGVIGYAYGELANTLREYLIYKGLATDYAYWNNSDEDDSVPTRQWRQREKAWSLALGEHEGSEFLFSFEGLNIAYESPPNWDALEQFVQEHAVRVDVRARNLVFGRWLKGRKQTEGTSFRQLREFDHDLASNGGLRAQIEDEVIRLTDLLPTNDALSQLYRETQPVLVNSHEWI